MKTLASPTSPNCSNMQLPTRPSLAAVRECHLRLRRISEASKDTASSCRRKTRTLLCCPRKIDGRWALIHRPVTTLGAHMWISYSPDLRHWGSHKVMLEARRGGWWDANKIGLCSPPIETARGWLVLYHGVRHTASGSIYRLGLALFDLDKPDLCLQRGDSWIFGPGGPLRAGRRCQRRRFSVRPDHRRGRGYH